MLPGNRLLGAEEVLQIMSRLYRDFRSARPTGGPAGAGTKELELDLRARHRDTSSPQRMRGGWHGPKAGLGPISSNSWRQNCQRSVCRP